MLTMRAKYALRAMCALARAAEAARISMSAAEAARISTPAAEAARISTSAAGAAQPGSTEQTRLPAHAIAADSRAPEKFLEAILLDLRTAGFIDSRRGHNGGHALARPAEQIMVGDLIRAIDGPLAPVRCASVTAYQPCNDCPDPHACGLRMLMREARDALCSVLDRRSLHDLALTWTTAPAKRGSETFTPLARSANERSGT